MERFVDAGPDGRRAFRNRYVPPGTLVPESRSNFQAGGERAPPLYGLEKIKGKDRKGIGN
jgi:hypothetical protein